MKKILRCSFLVLLLGMFSILFQSRTVSADATGCLNAYVKLFNYATEKEIVQADFYASLQLRLYENGIPVKTMKPLYGNTNYTDFLVGEVDMGYDFGNYLFKDNKTYETELILPEGYEIRNTVLSASEMYQTAGNRIRFTYNAELKDSLMSPGAGGGYGVSYYIKAPNDPEKLKIQLPKTSYSFVYAKKTVSLNATVTDNQPLTYKSDNSKVASVNSKGIVTVKRPGKAKITVTSKTSEKYVGDSKTVKFTIYPKKASIKKLDSPKNSTLKISWKKDSMVSGYELYLATDINFKKNVKHFIITDSSVTSKTIGKLLRGKYYYIKLRSYVNTSDVLPVRGSYSSTYRIKIK